LKDAAPELLVVRSLDRAAAARGQTHFPFRFCARSNQVSG
jgi:hypothetical protein